MKSWFRLLVVIFLVAACAYGGLALLVHYRGKALLTQKLQQVLDRKVTIESLNTSFPATLRIKNLKVEGLGSVDKIIAGGGLLNVFGNNFNLASLDIVRPRVNLADDIFKSAEKVPTSQGPKEITSLKQKKSLLKRFSVGRLTVSDGNLTFTDHGINTKGIVIKVRELNIKVDNLNLRRFGSPVTYFKIEGRIPWREGEEEGKINADGWVNVVKKDMRGTFKIEDIDGVYLYPYYSNWVDLEKARIESAKLNFTSELNGMNNNLTAECRLELANIVRKPLAEGESEEKASRVTNTVLDVLRTMDQGRVVLDFTIRTKMDRPQFGFGNVRSAFEGKLMQARGGSGLQVQNILLFPGRLLISTVRGTTDLSKALIDGTFAVGNEFKKAVHDTFQSAPQEKKE